MADLEVTSMALHHVEGPLLIKSQYPEAQYLDLQKFPKPELANVVDCVFWQLWV